MNARSKNRQLTFESTLEPTKGIESEVLTSNETDTRLRAVRVLPDVPAIDKPFDYLVPQSWIEDGKADQIKIGTMVRVPFSGRQVNGWVLETDIQPEEGINLLPLSKYRSVGPSQEVIELARWAAHRWAGRLNRFLTTASPPKNVPSLKKHQAASGEVNNTRQETVWFQEVAKRKKAVLRLPPSLDAISIASEFVIKGNTLILSPSISGAHKLAAGLKRMGLHVSVVPEQWQNAAVGGSVVGSRSAAFAPIVDLSAVVVFDEHDNSYQEERTPTWNARDVVIERANRKEIPCLLISAIPSLEALSWGYQIKLPRKEEREGWPIVEIIDRRVDDPTRSGLLSEKLTSILRESEGPVICILNRKGRSRLLACDRCGSLARCEKHQIPLTQREDHALECTSGCENRPVVCDFCGSTKFKNLRAGIARLREELQALSKKKVVEISSDSKGEIPDSDIYIGTEAALHRVERASHIVFLEFDQELLAPRFRAAEQAASLLIRSARIVGKRNEGGRLIVQTRQPEHEVLQAVLHANPEKLIEAESERRRLLKLPPYGALAQISGASASEMVASLSEISGIEIMGPRNDCWLVRADDNHELSKAISSVGRPKGKIRVEIDPRRA